MNDEAAGSGGSGSSAKGSSTGRSRGGGRSGSGRGRDPNPEEDLGNAAEVLRQIRAALEGADDRLRSMTDAAVTRAEDGAAAARKAAAYAEADDMVREVGRAASSEERATAKSAREFGELHREVLSLLTDDLERMADRVGIRTTEAPTGDDHRSRR